MSLNYPQLFPELWNQSQRISTEIKDSSRNETQILGDLALPKHSEGTVYVKTICGKASIMFAIAFKRTLPLEWTIQ